MSDSQNQPETQSPPNPATKANVKAVLIIVVLVVASGVALLALQRRYPISSDYVEQTFRVLLGLFAAGSGALIPGLVGIEVKRGQATIKIAGATSFFLIVYFCNPVTLVSIPARLLSPAKSSACAYYYNFISPLLSSMTFGTQIHEARSQQPINRRDVALVVLIPDTMADASPAGVKALLESRFQRAYVPTATRSYSVFVFIPKTKTNDLYIVDLPTGMGTLKRIIELRLGAASLDAADKRWKELEQKDVASFRETLQLLVGREPETRYRVLLKTEAELKALILDSGG